MFGNKFYNNTARNDSKISGSGYGGAIYQTCSEFESCLLIINDNERNSFINNYAENSGGAIYWDVLEPLMNVTNLTLVNNSAYLYGDDFACFP